MLYLTCTTITSIDLVHYGVSRAKDWVSVKCGTRNHIPKSRRQKISRDRSALYFASHEASQQGILPTTQSNHHVSEMLKL